MARDPPCKSEQASRRSSSSRRRRRRRGRRRKQRRQRSGSRGKRLLRPGLRPVRRQQQPTEPAIGSCGTGQYGVRLYRRPSQWHWQHRLLSMPRKDGGQCNAGPYRSTGSRRHVGHRKRRRRRRLRCSLRNVRTAHQTVRLSSTEREREGIPIFGRV